MTEKELDARIDNAPVEKVRACLKEIATLWFVEDGVAHFEKHIDSDITEAVTGALHTRGFSPKEGT
jgi:hypothetical protein